MTPFHPPAPARAPSRQFLMELDPDKWSIQPKYDGVRVLLWNDGQTSGVWTRHLTPLLRRSHIAEKTARELPAGMVVDGELVQGDLFLFDMAFADGAVCPEPLYDRLQELYDVFAWDWDVVLWRAEDVWRNARHIEGVVAKPLDSLYVASYGEPQSCGWLKWRYEWDRLSTS